MPDQSTTMTIPLTQGQVALVDAEDYERVSYLKWYASRTKTNCYALHKYRDDAGKWTVISLHRFVMDAPSGVQVDHENGNGLDCQKHNLRFATHAQNRQNVGRRSNNTSGYKGVSWHPAVNRWMASIKTPDGQFAIGYFDDPVHAARAYDAKARELHGAFARLNLPDAPPLATPVAVLRESNTSGYRGVTFHKQHGKWLAKINHEQRSRHLGLFDTPEVAARAYDDAARALKGARARLNFPD